MEILNKKAKEEIELLDKHLKQLEKTGNYNFFELKPFNDLEEKRKKIETESSPNHPQ